MRVGDKKPRYTAYGRQLTNPDWDISRISKKRLRRVDDYRPDSTSPCSATAAFLLFLSFLSTLSGAFDSLLFLIDLDFLPHGRPPSKWRCVR